ncbi:protein-L-isoaspartate(D-aspartate) O-methyltransferase [Candidatus Woesearchaeota archaeon]|nr:protein-L-isoaspartate(D-aspartate) O-methyltransferase [Candidatus Woesearchaeota archaeon]
MSKEELVNVWRSARIADEKLIEAFLKVPRESFVPEELKEEAYTDTPLPIRYGKTISQPTTIIIMTTALDVREGQKILEIGTGSGYQAAILARMAGEKGRVVTLEVVPELVILARENLKKAGVTNVDVIEDDGSQGHEKESPFDRVIVTAACPGIPEPLLRQLKPNGILVAPVGGLRIQEMVKVRKLNSGFERETMGEFMFLPLVGKHGFREDELD